MLDIPLLDPAFTGLNFSITGNMRAGIFVKEIVNKGPSQNETRRSPLVQLKTGLDLFNKALCDMLYFLIPRRSYYGINCMF